MRLFAKLILILSCFTLILAGMLSFKRQHPSSAYFLMKRDENLSGLYYYHFGDNQFRLLSDFPPDAYFKGWLTDDEWIYYEDYIFDSNQPDRNSINLYRMTYNSKPEFLARVMYPPPVDAWETGKFTFSPDKKWLAYSSPIYGSGLYALNMNTRELIELAAPLEGQRITGFVWSLDSQSIYFERWLPDEIHTAWLLHVSLDTQIVEKLVDLSNLDHSKDYYGVKWHWVNNNLLLRQSRSSNPSILLDLPHLELHPICKSGWLTLAASAQRIFCQFDRYSPIYRVNLQTFKHEALNSWRDSRLLEVIPELQVLVYEERINRDEEYTYIMQWDGENRQKLLNPGEFYTFITPDGEWVYYTSSYPPSRLFRKSLLTDEIQLITEASANRIPLIIGGIQLTPDQHYLIYHDVDIDRRLTPHYYRIDLDGRHKIQLEMDTPPRDEIIFSPIIDLPWYGLHLLILGGLGLILGLSVNIYYRRLSI